MQTNRFCIKLYVRGGPIVSRFSFRESSDLSGGVTRVEKCDCILNFTSEESQLMNGLVPWRGPREKDLSFMQGLIEVLTKPGDIILDWFASTGDTLFHVHFLLTY